MHLRLLSGLLIAFLFLVTFPAFAQDAASLKSDGDRLMDGLRYQDALEKYEAAYKLKSDPALLYNQGRALEGLGRFPDAVDKLVAFKEQASPELLNRLGAALTKNIDELRGRVALLTIIVEPAGASIRLGDRVLGDAPLSKLRVNAGAAHFEVSKEGYFTEVLDLTLKGGEENPLTVSLSPRDNRAALTVKSPVAGARVSVDGVPRGQVPVELKLSPGPHWVVVEQDGYEPSESVVELAPVEQKALDVELSVTPITYEWWFWTIIGAGLTGAGVGVGLALTLEEAADSGTLSPGQIQVSPPESDTGAFGGAACVVQLPAFRF